MGSQLQFAVNHVLHHLEHTILHLLGIVRLLDVFLQFPEAFLLYLFLGSKEEFALLMGTGDVFIHIDANQYSYLINIIQEGTQGEITRCTKETHYCIKILHLRVIAQNPLKLFHQRVPIPVSEEMGVNRYVLLGHSRTIVLGACRLYLQAWLTGRFTKRPQDTKEAQT